ncbi:hypothetical protein AC1031_020398 [Aphanomyces cochlioides]|nr:hypothetical protein AC1031_020398 [Aphanomyces cochlioides]
MEDMLLASCAAVSQTPGRTKKSRKAIEKTSKTVWTTEMVATLLEKRCDDFAANFELHRSAVRGKIALAINNLHGTSVLSSAVKNKYSSLKREYSTIRFAEKATGNYVAVTYPVYWERVVAAFADKDGFGRIDYAYAAGQTSTKPDDESDCDSDETGDSTNKRRALVEAELARQRAKRSKKLDIGQSLVALGESLAEGLKGMHKPTTEAKEPENKNLLVAIDKLQVAVEQSTLIQSGLLAYLRRNNS